MLAFTNKFVPNVDQVQLIEQFFVYCRSGEEQSHKSPTPGGGPDEYRRAVKSILIYLENTSGI